MKRFSILIYCVDIVRVVSFGQTLVTTQKEGHFELSLRDRDDCVVNKPSISLVIESFSSEIARIDCTEALQKPFLWL